MRNRFTTRNQWFTETIETIRTSEFTLIISTIWNFKTFTAEFRFNLNRLYILSLLFSIRSKVINCREIQH
ncbi:MAG: hypothetical protein LCH44_07740 [Bacteroidetes bacterium]|nr:hypothetical protein [Bacteroidota bacterium]MCO5278747.1 hypothetical protein [Saprospiraceae bacterium]